MRQVRLFCRYQRFNRWWWLQAAIRIWEVGKAERNTERTYVVSVTGVHYESDRCMEFCHRLSKRMIIFEVLGWIWTDGVPAMLYKSWGFLAYVKKEVDHMKIASSMLHCHALVAKTSPMKMNNTLLTTVKAMNFVLTIFYRFARKLLPRILSFCFIVNDVYLFPVNECLLLGISEMRANKISRLLCN
jgi:hypothetical protein